MKTLTRADIEALMEHPEQASLRISPQVLADLRRPTHDTQGLEELTWFMDGYWVRPDGKKVRMTEVRQWDDGELSPVFVTSDE